MGKHEKPILVFQTDFTYAEGAVSSMYGVVKCVDRELEIFDGTHEIPKFDTWSASYRLWQSLPFWPEGTIYVSVVDPGVGTGRRPCAAKTADGHIVISPDNGSLTHVAQNIGITEVREINEEEHRLKQTAGTSVFHGRDLFGHTAAKLASGLIAFEDIGEAYPVKDLVLHDIALPRISEGRAEGIFEINDPNFGNLWTNIPLEAFTSCGFAYGDTLHVTVTHGAQTVISENIRFEKSFGYVEIGSPVIYNNEMMKIALAVSQGSFCERYGAGYGTDWQVVFTKEERL